MQSTLETAMTWMDTSFESNFLEGEKEDLEDNLWEEEEEIVIDMGEEIDSETMVDLEEEAMIEVLLRGDLSTGSSYHVNI